MIGQFRDLSREEASISSRSFTHGSRGYPGLMYQPRQHADDLPVPCLLSCRVTAAFHGAYRHGTEEVIPSQRYLYDIVT